MFFQQIILSVFDIFKIVKLNVFLVKFLDTCFQKVFFTCPYPFKNVNQGPASKLKGHTPLDIYIYHVSVSSYLDQLRCDLTES